MYYHLKKMLSLITATIFFIGCKEAKKETTISIENSKPNIVLIVADDMGWFDLACYGNDFIETPNLDAMANDGIRFTDGYAAAPLCSPSRASLVTGLHPISVNITEHIHGNRPAGPHQKLQTPAISQHLDLEYTTIPEVLKAKQYRTAHIGKWHLGGGNFSPQYQGYDLNIAGAWNGLPNSFFYPFFPMGEKPEIQNDANEGDYLTDVLTNKAIDFITQQKDTTFFLSLNYYSPHVPIEAKEKLVEKYRKKRGNDDESIMPNIYYAAMIESIDQNVGRILNTLETLGLEKNTLVVFTSDNGGLSVKEVPAFAKHTPPTDNGYLRKGKGYLYEGGIREPFIMKWPLVIKPNQTNKTPVIAQDLFNTFIDVTGSEGKTKDGVSLVPIFKGESLAERGLLWHLPHYSPQHGKPSSAYREGKWKIIRFYEDERYELYDLEEDVSESKNLANIKTKKFIEMKDKLNSALQTMGANFPEPNPNYVGEKPKDIEN
ncbi:arylsulfatase A-like enzyme [Jejuia pallidilutea]|uniref:Arylsulfatase A-like enzyme n=1 Tax=Jejuia pallidilutea TaxID=504487 RepID=A0A362X0D2_9FLAO|nr:sulfatase [Jejuia pallidilutea]PQV48838.1 arylsulfatase A-like enzyme [Jejuia pallidilutea]